jgi:hypothetical protein
VELATIFCRNEEKARARGAPRAARGANRPSFAC